MAPLRSRETVERARLGESPNNSRAIRNPIFTPSRTIQLRYTSTGTIVSGLKPARQKSRFEAASHRGDSSWAVMGHSARDFGSVGAPPHGGGARGTAGFGVGHTSRLRVFAAISIDDTSFSACSPRSRALCSRPAHLSPLDRVESVTPNTETSDDDTDDSLLRPCLLITIIMAAAFGSSLPQPLPGPWYSVCHCLRHPVPRPSSVHRRLLGTIFHEPDHVEVSRSSRSSLLGGRGA